MSLSDVYRNRYYDEGYVLIAGSQSTRLVKIGTTQDAVGRERRQRNVKYGGVPDWKMLYYVWLEVTREASNMQPAGVCGVVRFCGTTRRTVACSAAARWFSAISALRSMR